MQSEGSSYKVTILKNSEKPTGLHPLLSGIGNERVKERASIRRLDIVVEEQGEESSMLKGECEGYDESELKGLLGTYDDVFSDNPGSTERVKMSIETGNSEPIRQTLSNSNHTTVSRDSNHTVSNSKPAELLQQTTHGFQAAGIVREYPDRGNSPHALSIREVLFHETGCHISVVEPSRSSYQRILLIGPLALALALARRYNWSRAAL